MENTLTAVELKRRGMAAIEDSLKRGPVRIIKRNKPAAVVVSAAEYECLSGTKDATVPGMTALQWLLTTHAEGKLGKRQIDDRLREERNW